MRIGRLLTFAAMALLTACGGDVKSGNTQTGIVPMRVVTDDLERRILVPTTMKRVISLAPNLTESIFAVGAGDRLVGVTTYCNYPEQANSIAKVGDTMNPNMETIVGLKPDVVFVSTASQVEAFAKTLELNGIAVYVTDPATIEDIIRVLEQFSVMFNTETIADPFIDTLSRRYGHIRSEIGGSLQRDESESEREKRLRPPRVFVQISKEPLFTVGGDSFLEDVILLAGGKLVTADVKTAFPRLSKETAIVLDPEVIVLSESDDNREPNEVFKNSKAVKSGRVISINADLLSRPGPRLIDALEYLARELHPEKLK